MLPKFFITHSWKDIEFANKLRDDLYAAGLDGFIDSHSIKPGDSIPSQIENGLNDCDVYLPVFSPDMLASEWCDWEIDMAITMNRNGNDHPRIIPVIARQCLVPNRLGHLLHVSFIGRYDDALNELLTRGFGLPPKLPAAPVSPPLPEPKAHGMPVAPPLPEPIAPAVTVATPLAEPKAPAATRARVNRPVLIVSALVAVMILIVGSIVVSRSGLFGQSTSLGIGSIKTAADSAPMMFVPAGEFLMGSSDADKQAESDEKPQHPVYLDAFWIDKYEVTNALYKKCVDVGQCPEPADWVNGAIPPGKENHPVVGVIWNDAVAYARWTGGHLPTEAEWEKAACWDEAHQVKRIYPWGDVFDQNVLNSSESGKGETTPVDHYPRGVSPYGVLDMAGNVQEWTADWYNASYYSNSPKANPKGPDSGDNHVLRGGSWGDGRGSTRCAYRNGGGPGDRLSNVGFRVAESVSL